jgi:hypothetical protein
MCAAESVYIPLPADELREGLAAGFTPLDSGKQAPKCALCTAMAAWIRDDMALCTPHAHRGTADFWAAKAAATRAVLEGLGGLLQAEIHDPFHGGAPVFCVMRSQCCQLMGVVVARGTPYCYHHFMRMVPQYFGIAVQKARESVQADGGPQCAVCLERRVTRIVQPCKHAVLCGACLGDVLREPQGRRRCPMCQNFIESSDTVYF